MLVDFLFSRTVGSAVALLAISAFAWPFIVGCWCLRRIAASWIPGRKEVESARG